MNEKKRQCINLQAKKDESVGKNELIFEYNKICNLVDENIVIKPFMEKVGLESGAKAQHGTYRVPGLSNC